MLDKPLDSLTESDIQQAVVDRIPEDKQLEYKETLPGSDHESKKEFLADVSAMANAAGGLILYGIAEERDANNKTTGIPSGSPGLQDINLDQEKRRLENLLRDGIKPRIQGIGFRAIPLSSGALVLGVGCRRAGIPRMSSILAGTGAFTFATHPGSIRWTSTRYGRPRPLEPPSRRGFIVSA